MLSRPVDDTAAPPHDDSRDRLGGQTGLLPCLKPALKGANAHETAIEQHVRQTGARGLARSGAVQHDLLVGRQRMDVMLEFAGRDPPRALDHLRGPAVGVLAP